MPHKGIIKSGDCGAIKMFENPLYKESNQVKKRSKNNAFPWNIIRKPSLCICVALIELLLGIKSSSRELPERRISVFHHCLFLPIYMPN